ncbi:MAG: hypothetical protein WCJ02_06390 [bacterium]
MKNFWIPFVLILISGTAVIYYFAPICSVEIMPFVPNWMKPQAPTLESTTRIKDMVDATTLPREPPPKNTEVLPEDNSFVSPALEGIYYARAEHPGWGITHQKTSYYNEKGAYLGTLDSGEIINCLKTKITSSKGDLLECQLRNSTNAVLFVARKDAHFFTGDLNKLAAKQIQMLVTYYQLTTKIPDRRRKLLEENATLNPHLQASRVAYQALIKNIEEAKLLQQQQSTATDSKKTELDEALLALKIKEAGLKKAFDEVQKNFIEWKMQHASQFQNPDSDPTIKTWIAEKQKLKTALPGLAF